MVKLRQDVSLEDMDFLQFGESQSCPGIHVTSYAGEVLQVVNVNSFQSRDEPDPE